VPLTISGGPYRWKPRRCTDVASLTSPPTACYAASPAAASPPETTCRVTIPRAANWPSIGAAVAGAVSAGHDRGLKPAERALASWARTVANELASGLPAVTREAVGFGPAHPPDWTIRIALPNGSRRPKSVP
jgi:hypothetical protein